MSKWITLRLSSPHMTDARVHKMGGTEHEVSYAQRLLTHNRFKDFEPGAVDGEYGLHSHDATHRAKFWLGYKKSQVNGAMGPNLVRFLQGSKLPAANRVRRAKRLLAHRVLMRKRNQIVNVRARALKYMGSQIGTKESPYGSNHTKYGVWYGVDHQPWCAIFQTYAWCVGAGYSKGRSFTKHANRWAYVPNIVADGRAHRNGLEAISSLYVKPGDLVCYDFTHSGVAEHVETFDGWIVRGSSFWAIGGNTGSASFSNGGEVLRSERYVSQVQAYVRVTA